MSGTLGRGVKSSAAVAAKCQQTPSPERIPVSDARYENDVCKAAVVVVALRCGDKLLKSEIPYSSTWAGLGVPARSG